MKRSDRDQFLQHFSVSRETLQRLDRYAELLKEWNKKFNLVAESTIPELWTRHFLDSAQIMHFIPDGAKTLADMGSGAGFPGVVLSILGLPEVHLVESIGKKADFLRTVSRETHLNIHVHQCRIESLHNFKVDVVTARALKPLPELMGLAKPLMKKASYCIFLKGQNVQDELTESAQSWTFDYATSPSISDPSGSVLIIRSLQPKNAAPRGKHKRKK